MTKRVSNKKQHTRSFFPGMLGLLLVLMDFLEIASLISVEGNQYSAPSRWARRRVQFRRFESHLELLDGRDTAGTIQLENGRGKRIICDEHYPAHERAKQRTTASNPLQAQFEGLVPEAAAYLQGLSQSRVGTLRDQMERIIALVEDYPPSLVGQAMQRALEYGSFGYGTLKRILQRLEKAPESLPDLNSAEANLLPAELNVDVEKRDLNYYTALEVVQ